LLSGYYNGPYFFDSKVLEEEPPLCIEFNKIYRQRDEQFIQLLNQVRDNQLDADSMKILESRFYPAFRRTKQDGYIILTTHNNKAADINNGELARLNNPLFRYEAEIMDEFSDRAYPADEVLSLKEGAQVMFIRNDPAEKGKRFFNGKLGTVSRLEANKIFVQCENGDSEEEIEVQKEKWENIRYTINKSTRHLESEVLGSFTQYPLRLAWAITIHKSQGLTFEKAIIDAGEAFAAGQVYVALSRCTSLDGMVLQSRIRPGSISNDPRIVEFSKRSASGNELKSELTVAGKKYQQSLLVSLFSYSGITTSIKELQDYLLEHSGSFNEEAMEWTAGLLLKINRLQDIGSKFSTQLQTLFRDSPGTMENRPLQQRIVAAAAYFIPETEAIMVYIRQSPAVTDSKLHSKEYNDSVKEVFARLAEKGFLLEGLKNGFDPDAFMLYRTKFILPAFTINAYAGAGTSKTESPHPALYQQLRKLRDNLCAKKDLPIYLVAGSSTLDELARYLPHDLQELRKISGFGEAKTEQYGQQFLDIILDYCRENNLGSLIHEKIPKRERRSSAQPGDGKKTGDKKKGETYAESFRLFREGKSVAEIAAERKLAAGTIESHLTRYIASGDIRINELVKQEKFQRIEAALKEYDGTAITPVKQKLGDDVSFGEIRWVMASMGIVQERTTE
jgi:hypothetical protein